MIYLKTLLNVLDNTGARVVECVNVLRRKTVASIGDEIVCVVKRARPIAHGSASSSGAGGAAAGDAAAKLKKGDVVRAVVVRTRKPVRRPDGSFVAFDDNAVVILNDKKEPLGNRVSGVIAAEVRTKGWAKVASLAPKVV